MYSKYVSQVLDSKPTILIGGKVSWLMEDILLAMEKRGYETVIAGRDRESISHMKGLFFDRSVLFIGNEPKGYVKLFFTLIKLLKRTSGDFPVDVVIAEDFRNFIEKKEIIGKYYGLLQILHNRSKLIVVEPDRGASWKDVVSQGDAVSKKIVDALFSIERSEVVYIKIQSCLDVKEVFAEKRRKVLLDKKDSIRNTHSLALDLGGTPIDQIDKALTQEEDEREEQVMRLFSEISKEVKKKKEEVLLSVGPIKKNKSGKMLVNKKILEIFGYIFSFMGVLIFCICVFTFLNILVLKNSFLSIEKSFQEKKFDNAKKSLKTYEGANDRVRFIYEKTGSIFSILIGEESFNNIGKILSLNNSASNVLSSTLDMTSSLTLMYEKTMSSKDGGISILEENRWKVEDAYKKLSIYLSEAQNAKDISIFSYGTKMEKYKNAALVLQRQLVGVQQLSQIFPELMGKDKKMTYLFLVQNSNELRPTGGFLQSLVFVTFQKGELLDYQVFDVPTTDSLLNGRVESPKDLKETLGGTSWYLRDSNWSGDFEESAKQAKWFVEKELGRTVDGVIGINTQLYPKLLSSLGNVSVPEYDEDLTEKNVLERISSHNELAVVDGGASGKKDMLTMLTKSLFQSIVGASGPKVESMGVVLMDSLRKNEIFVYMDNPELQRIFLSLGWSGTITSPPCPQQFFQQNCYVDRLFAVESNVGVNKVNPYIERSVKHDVILDGENAIHMHVLTIKNTATSTTWPLGTYKNYQRFYLPQPAQVNSILIDGVPVEKSKLFFENSGVHEVVGVYIEVPIKETSTMTVSYTVPLVKKQGQIFTYAFFIQKQAGILEVPTTLSISVKKPGIFEKIAPAGKVAGQKVEYEDLLQTSFFAATQVKGL